MREIGWLDLAGAVGPGAQLINTLAIDVESDHRDAGPRERSRYRQPDITEADNSKLPAVPRPMLHAAQIRAARALLGWRQEQLAKASGVGAATIQRIERSVGPVGGYVSTLTRIQSAFEQAGIVFLDDDAGGGIGVRLAHSL